MTQRPETVELPFARRHVQLTIAVSVSALFLWLLIASAWSAFQPSQHNRLHRDGEVADGGRTALIRIDLNVAEARELALLPRVGPILANRIVENRARLGPFQSVGDLGRVHGIGPKTLGEIRTICVVNPESRVEQGDPRLAASLERSEPDR